MTLEMTGLFSMLEYTGNYFPRRCEPVESLGYVILIDMIKWISLVVLLREAISRVCEAVPGAKGAFRKRKVLSLGSASDRVFSFTSALFCHYSASLITENHSVLSSHGLALVTFFFFFFARGKPKAIP